MPKFWPGSPTDRQQRVAQSSQNFDQVRGTPLSLAGKDALPPGQSTHDSRRPIAFLLRTTRFQAQISGQVDQVHATPLPLQGKDAVAPGQSTLDTRRPLNAYINRRTVDLWTYLDASEFWLFGTDKFPPGQSTLDTRRPTAYWARAFRYPVFDANSGNAFLPEQTVATIPAGQGTLSSALPPRVAPRSVDLLTFLDPSEVWLFGTDAMAAGQQSFALAPNAPARARDYSIGESFPPTLVGQDALNVGAQAFALPPSAPPRARDYSWSQELIPDLVGQDAMAAGQQSYALPPIAPLRSRDYTFAPAINLSCLTTVVQQIPYGAQSTDSLPAHSAARAKEYSWSQVLIPNLIGQDQLNTGQQSYALVPSPAPLRARDYTFTDSFFPGLIGQDAMAAGAQSTALPPIAPLRARDYSFTPPVNLPALTTVVQQIPYGAQNTDSLPAHSALRAKDYSWSQDLIPNLIGQDQLNAGAQSFDLAPRPAPLRARDYTYDASFPLTLISQDAMATGAQRWELPPIAALRARDYSFVLPLNLPCQSTIQQPIPPGQQTTDNLAPRAALRLKDYTYLWPVQTKLIGQDALPTGQNADRTALPPKAAARARDYTWTQPYQLYIFEQLPTGHSNLVTEGPPKGPLRLRDYTHYHALDQQLAGQDAMVTGRQTTDSDNLPPRAYPRLRDYTVIARFSLPDLISHTKPGHHTLSNRALYAHTLYDRALYAHTLADQEMS